MKSKEKNIILAIIAIVIIIIIGIVVLISIKKNKNVGEPHSSNEPLTGEENNEILEPVTVRNDYYIVKNSVAKFYSYYYSIYNAEKDNYILDDEAIESIKKIKQKNIQAVYEMLDQEYINFKQVTVDNLESKFPAISTNRVNINKMYVIKKRTNVETYLVDGYLLDETTKSIDKFDILANIDVINGTFTIVPNDYVETKYSSIKIGEDLNFNAPDTIELNDANKYSFKNISDEDYILDVFEKLKNELLYNPEEAYNNLNEEYRQKKFNSIEEFKEFAKRKTRELVIAQVTTYQKTKYDNYTQFVCGTNSGKYYIINEKSLLDYEYILDTYTIDLPQFTEKYNAASADEKAGMNIQKVIDAINDSDYHYVYSKLDETFKKSNFSSEDAFKKYAEQNFGNKRLEYESSKQEGDLYISDITIKENETSIAQKKIIMKLLDGTDFVMSFNIN